MTARMSNRGASRCVAQEQHKRSSRRSNRGPAGGAAAGGGAAGRATEEQQRSSSRAAGQQEEQAKEMAFLSKALLIALFLIFLIIVSQFNSVTTPFIIGFSVVFSLIGVLLGLVIFQLEFVIIMTMIGIISLAGVVVNNAIVLIDYTNLLRARRREELGLEEGESAEDATKLPFSTTCFGSR